MPSRYKLTLHRWACVNGLSILSAMQAQQAVVAVERMWQFSIGLRRRQLDGALPGRPDYRRWLQLYRRHGQVFKATVGVLPEFQLLGQPCSELFKSWQWISRESRQNPEGLKATLKAELAQCPERSIRIWFRRGARQARKSYDAHLGEIATMIAGEEDNEDLTWIDEALRSSAEFYFFFRIVLPCLIEYCMLPIDLLRRARGGDERAIERLLRLDDLALHDLRITHWINGEGGQQRFAWLEDATKWAKEGPIGQNHQWHFKECVGGLISALSHQVFFILDGNRLKPQPLTAPQIMDLFDALYRDKQGRREAVMTDPDFANVNPESWSRAIGRYRAQWDRVLFHLDPDKKSPT